MQVATHEQEYTVRGRAVSSAKIQPEGTKGGLSQQFCGVTLVILLVLAAALRLDFMRAVGYAIDGDEAIVGLMGKHILEGRGVPAFYYGQHYMGSLEAILASVSFAVFGVTPFALQLVPLLCSLGLIVVLFFLTKSVMNARAGLIAAALMSFAPPALLVWSTKARGGFIEVVAIGAITMLVVVKWIRTHPERLGYPFALGVLLGLGWWVNNQVVYFIVPVGIFGLMHACSRSMRLAGNGRAGGTTHGLGRSVAIVGAAGIVAFLVGSSPWWIYNLKRGFPSAGMFTVVDWDTFREHLRGLRRVALPMIVGAQRFWQRDPLFPYAKEVAFGLYGLPIGMLVLLRIRILGSLAFGFIDRRRPIELLVLFCCACCGIFALSSFGGLVQAPRYLLPLYVGIFSLVAICCELLIERNKRVGYAYLAALILFQICASYLGGRAVNGEPVVFASDRVARDHAPLVARLAELGITKVRTNYWIGYRLAFETKEGVIFKQIGEPFQIRLPQYEYTSGEDSDLLPLVLVKAQVPTITAALARMGFEFSAVDAGEYRILYGLRRIPKRAQRLTFASGELTLSAPGSVDPRFAFDGRRDTRWGTGAPQTAGQSFVLELPAGVVLDGIGYSVGRWWPDRPRELKIEIESPEGGRKVVLSPFEARGTFDLTIGDGAFAVRFEPSEVRRVILSQLGNDAVFDWSIAEIELFGERR